MGGLSPESFKSLAMRYFLRLEDELDSRSNLHGIKIDTVYFGGGTPSIVLPSLIESLTNKLRSRFRIIDGAEISIECNPEDFSRDLLSRWMSIGINRVTMGVQSFSPHLRSLIGRRSKGPDRRLMESFMSAQGIVHGLDLITAIFGSSDVDFLCDLKLLIDYRPEHISAYMLSVDEGTPLSRGIITGADGEEEQRRKFEKTMDVLIENGYIHYEISNFALPSFESRHNMKYWKYQPYIGLGVRAHSFIHGQRFFNDQTLDEYLRKPSLREDYRDKNGAMAEYLMMSLRLVDGFTDHEFKTANGVIIPDEVMRVLEIREKRGLLEIRTEGEEARYKLSRDGIFWADSILYDVVESLL